MNKRKIIFIDVNGTLLDYENILPASAAKAIKLARKNSHKVYICTGSSKSEVYDYVWDIGLDGMIGGNGAYVHDGDTILLDQVIDAATERRVVDWLHNKGLEFYLESNSGLYASENFEARADKTVKEYSRRKEKNGSSDMTVRKFFPKMLFGENLYRDNIKKSVLS